MTTDTQTAEKQAATPGGSDLQGQRLTLTPGAVTQVRQVMKDNALDGHWLTIRVVPGGCSGMNYDLNLIKESKTGDVTWEQEGIRVCTDPVSLGYLQGTVVDYVKTDHHAGFKFTNPNARASCGCGSSFSA